MSVLSAGVSREQFLAEAHARQDEVAALFADGYEVWAIAKITGLRPTQVRGLLRRARDRHLMLASG